MGTIAILEAKTKRSAKVVPMYKKRLVVGAMQNKKHSKPKASAFLFLSPLNNATPMHTAKPITAKKRIENNFTSGMVLNE